MDETTKYINKVILCGHVLYQPELKYTRDGLAVLNFKLKTITSWTCKITCKPKSIYKIHNIVCWNNNAIYVSKFIKRNSLILVCGELNYIDSYTQNIKYLTAEIKASYIKLIK